MAGRAARDLIPTARTPDPPSARVIYAREFFGLQLRFALAASTLSGRPLPDVLLGYTNIYIRLGLGREFDPAHPGWRAYVGGISEARDALDWTYERYRAQPEAATAPPLVASFGCFAYGRLGDGRVRLHFQNAEAGAGSPLGPARQARRLAELAALFDHVKRTMPPPVRVVGASWLYNLEAYRRLFPPAYLATARALPDRFRHMPLWGQFVDRRGGVRKKPARQFLERVERAAGVADLGACFPLQPLGLEAPADEFYAFHHL